MAKLNKMEISAIAEQIVADVTTKVSEYNTNIRKKEFEKWLEGFKETDDYKTLKKYEKIEKDVERIYNETRGYSYNILRTSEVLNQMFGKAVSVKTKSYPSKQTIEREIIISQAKSEDLDELIKKLTEKYS